jgi:hypothetical protein
MSPTPRYVRNMKQTALTAKKMMSRNTVSGEILSISVLD